jgi:hypothetical protein
MTQGSNLMSETLAEDFAVKVMEKKTSGKYLKYGLDRYLCVRAGETRHEPPLSRVQREPYVWYQKGDYIGEEKLNGALKKFLEQNKYAKGPYPDTIGFAAAIREDASPSFNTWSRICLSPSCCTRTKP